MAKGMAKVNLSEKFLFRLNQIFGRSNVDNIISTFKTRPTTFRVNTIKSDTNEVLRVLQQHGFKVKRVPWFSHAFILENKKQSELMKTDLFLDGNIYLQSLASMVPAIVLDPQPGEKILDLTAAPGSKTSQIAMMMEKNGELVANELDPIRFEKLVHNMRLLGVFDEEKNDWECKLLNADGIKLFETYHNYFDKILLDAPCSAEARIDLKDRRSYSYWNEKNIKDHAFVQKKLLFCAWTCLKPGGTLVYSTCTFAPEENESQLVWLKDKFPGEVTIDQISLQGLKISARVREWKGQIFSDDIGNSLRIMPDTSIEGFFIAKLTKKEV